MTGQPTSPIPRPDHGDDPRLCLGLAMDIAKILTAYGYPPITGADLVYWQRLLTTIYQEKA